jgi:hypothetical protein
VIKAGRIVPAMSPFVKGFSDAGQDDGTTRTEAGVRKPQREETAAARRDFADPSAQEKREACRND